MNVTDQLPERAILVLISAVSWAAFTYLNSVAFDFLKEAPGVHLVYMPAGVRLLILLLFGVWGAIGIAIAHPIAVLTQYNPNDVTFLITDSLISGFGGLLVLFVSQKLLGISPSLDGLRAKHLPLLSLMMAIAMPFMFNAAQVVFGYRPVSEVTSNFWPMLLGDFLGCFIVIAVVLLLIKAFRALYSGSHSSGN